MTRQAMTSLFGKFPPFFCAGLKLCFLISVLIGLVHAQDGRLQNRFAVPVTWDDKVMNAVEVPLANPIGSPKHVSADYYYRIPVRPVYQQYPVYAPSREPAGYMESLKKKDPVIIWDGAEHAPALRTEQDWIRAERWCSVLRSSIRRIGVYTRCLMSGMRHGTGRVECR